MRITLTQAHIALIVSIAALSLSSASFYHQWWRAESEMYMQVLQFDMSLENDDQNEPEPACTVEIALFNTGNRDAALIGLRLHHGAAATTRGVGTIDFEYTGRLYYLGIDLHSSVSEAVKSGDIRLLIYRFPECTMRSIHNGVSTENHNLLSLEATTIDYRGGRSTVKISFARTDIADDKSIVFSLNKGGHFNLQNDGAFYYGHVRGVDTLVVQRREDGYLLTYRSQDTFQHNYWPEIR